MSARPTATTTAAHAATTPQQRLEQFARLQRRALAVLRASPEGYAHFWRRNLRQRRIRASS